MKYSSFLLSLLLSIACISCSSDANPAGDISTKPPSTDSDKPQPGNPETPTDTPYVCSADTCTATCCNNVCRDTTSNVNHCGECDHACQLKEVCEKGVCIPASASSCPIDELLCGEECTSVVDNPDHCGACDHVCASDETCVNRLCVRDCKGLAHCGDSCVDLLADAGNCGKCGNACAAEEACINGVCTDTCPGANEVICSQTCADLQTNPNHCGQCGTACLENEVCLSGSCTDTCPNEGEVICNHQCVNLQSDPTFCGSCDNACQDTERCAEGSCVSTCENANSAICGHVCIDVTNDSQNCGGCHAKCNDNEVCSHGVCGCPADNPNCNESAQTCTDTTKTLCNDLCVDLQNDNYNCGSCGHACGDNVICSNGVCLDCTGKIPCDDGGCYDLKSDPQNCGGCGVACPANVACVDGQCASCKADYIDCDGDPSNGCEKTTADCSCVNGQEADCYYGPAGTAGVGACKAGKMTCNNNKWSECVGMVLPQTDYVCRKDIADSALNDLNCDGKVDGTLDLDGDGLSICDGDCCDSKAHCPTVSDPATVREGYHEVPGNKIDDNCNDEIDEDVPACDATYSTGVDLEKQDIRDATGVQFARAMDICDVYVEGDSKKNYGLVSATLQSLNSETHGNKKMSYAVRIFPSLSKAGTSTPIITPKKGKHFVGISTGEFNNGKVSGSASFIKNGIIPSKYLYAHGGVLQSAEGCPTVSEGINDSVNLHLVLKAPLNATGFSFEFRFYSHEYWLYLCDQFNDFFLVLLDSKASGIPADGNIAFDKVGNPVSVNNAFFTACKSPTCTAAFNTTHLTNGCPNSLKCESGKCVSPYGACPDGPADVCAFDSDCGEEETSGGATAWLKTTAPVVGGETFTLDFYLWDTSDNQLDSAAIIDNFQWITTGGTVTVGTDFSDPRT
ncbi:MAG: choice-of-anchor L domain-containing protein [Proteobacteria bacterium]|nr:choice-of-anchor L domain-containing protein [Pseudomonadota bacterium]